MLTMAPDWFGIIAFIASREWRKAPVTFVAICQFQSSRVISTTGL